MRPEDQLDAEELTLRRYRVTDALALHEAVVESTEELRSWMPWAALEPLTVSDREALIVGPFETGWAEETDFQYGMFSGQRVVGGCGLHRRIGPDGLEIGYWVRSTCTGRGLATVAAGLLVEAAFRLPHVHHVEIHHDAANRASRRIPEKLGFVLCRQVEDGVSAPGEVGVSWEWRLERRSS